MMNARKHILYSRKEMKASNYLLNIRALKLNCTRMDSGDPNAPYKDLH